MQSMNYYTLEQWYSKFGGRKNHLESLSKNINATLCPEFARGMYIFVKVILLIKLTSPYYKSHLVTFYLITACGYLHTDSPVLLTDAVFFYFAL